MSIETLETIAHLSLFYIPFLFAISFHEFAHALVAKWKGDSTAEDLGRLSLNPLVHADFLGTFLLPIMAALGNFAVFGWAKPVPVNSRNLSNVKNDMFWIALAGPASNLFLAVLGGIMFGLVKYLNLEPSMAQILFKFTSSFIYINVLLCLFNMIPLHPLDGGKVLERFLPARWNQFLYEHQGTAQILLIGLFILGGFQYLARPVIFFTDFLIRLI